MDHKNSHYHIKMQVFNIFLTILWRIKCDCSINFLVGCYWPKIMNNCKECFGYYQLMKEKVICCGVYHSFLLYLQNQ